MVEQPDAAGGEDARRLAVTRIVLRPIGTPLPLGFLALTVATTLYSALQLGWVPRADTRLIGLAVLVLTVPLQAVAFVFGFLARDPIAGTGMGMLAGTWAATGALTVAAPPETSNPALGIVLLVGAVSLLVPALSAGSKLLAAAVMGAAAGRFALTGIFELTGAPGWRTAAGAFGLLVAAVALYAALAFELEEAHGRTVLPVVRRGGGRTAVSGDVADQVAGVEQEAGVRRQL